MTPSPPNTVRAARYNPECAANSESARLTTGEATVRNRRRDERNPTTIATMNTRRKPVNIHSPNETGDHARLPPENMPGLIEKAKATFDYVREKNLGAWTAGYARWLATSAVPRARAALTPGSGPRHLL